MITKYGKKSICGILTAIVLISTSPINARAAAATYTAYEIISMIFAVVGGTTIQQTQGLVGGGTFDEDAIYQSMNAQQAGMGNLLSSYVDRAQYLSPGSELVLSEADYNAFREYFRQYSIQTSTTGQITNESVSGLESALSQRVGYTVPNIGSDIIQMINNGTIVYAIICKERKTDTTNQCILASADVHLTPWDPQNDEYDIKADTMRRCYSTGSGWGASSSLSCIKSTVEYITLLGAISAKADATVTPKIKNGTYDTLSKSREWDATQGKIVGPCTITMPATSTLSDVLEADNVKGITDALNVYPVDTADDSMIYYPTQSAEDFKVPEMTVETNVNVQFPAIEGEAGAYTMDLTSFFPFCIPFDIYAFMQAFEAEPEAPSITYNFPYVNNAGNVVYIQQTFNLSQFDSVAQLVRRLELIAFIVGLAFVTRSFFLRG